MAWVLNSGFWSVDGSCFFDKGEAYRFATRTQKRNIKYHYFDEVYGTVNWDIEPPQPLDYYYTQRALELRDKYEYVALSFSGGADSTNVLRTFIKNKIKLDEVVVWYPVTYAEKVLGNFNPHDKSAGNIIYEYHTACLPVLKWLATNHPDIKITVLDYTETPFNMVQSDSMRDARMSGSLSHAMSTGQYLMTDHLRKVNKKVCQLLAVDKPRIKYNKKLKRWECYFHDFNNMMCRWGPESFNRTEPKTEYFYYAPTMPMLLVKQCYVIRHAMMMQNYIPDALDSPDGSSIIFWPHTDFIKKAIYPEWDTSIFQAEKASKFFYHEHTQWFLDSIKNDKRMMDFYEGQLDEMKSGIAPDLLDYEDGRAVRFKDVFSRYYYF